MIAKTCWSYWNPVEACLQTRSGRNRDGVLNVWDVLDLRQYGQTNYSGC